MNNWLEKSWWQGVAGIAQILAGIFSVITIIQARRTIKQADQARRESVAPYWDLIEVRIEDWTPGVTEITYKLVFKNTGFGPARNLAINTDLKGLTISEPSPDITCYVGKGKVYVIGDQFKTRIKFRTNMIPFNGSLFIYSSTVFGYCLEHTIKISVKSGKNIAPNFEYSVGSYRFLKG